MTRLLRQISELHISPVALAAVFGVALFAYLILYFLLSGALYTMARRKRKAFSFIAWFPFIRLYLVGSLVDESVEIFELTLPYTQVLLPVMSILSKVFSLIPVLGTVLSLVFKLYQSIVYHKLFRLCGYKHPLIPAIAVFVLPILAGAFLYPKRKQIASFTAPETV